MPKKQLKTSKQQVSKSITFVASGKKSVITTLSPNNINLSRAKQIFSYDRPNNKYKSLPIRGVRRCHAKRVRSFALDDDFT